MFVSTLRGNREHEEIEEIGEIEETPYQKPQAREIEETPYQKPQAKTPQAKTLAPTGRGIESITDLNSETSSNRKVYSSV